MLINTIYPVILNNEFYTKENTLKNIKKYKYYIMFIKALKMKNIKEYTTFYDIYKGFNTNNKYDLFQLDEEGEKYDFLPIIINYRNLDKNKLLCIKYSINHSSTWKRKFKNQITKNNLLSIHSFNI